MHKPHTFILVLALAWCCRLPAQQSLTPHLSSLLPLSPSEERYHTVNADLSLKSTAVLYANPVFTHWRSQNDTTSHHRTAIVYAGVGSGDAKGDFIPTRAMEPPTIASVHTVNIPHDGHLITAVQFYIASVHTVNIPLSVAVRSPATFNMLRASTATSDGAAHAYQSCMHLISPPIHVEVISSLKVILPKATMAFRSRDGHWA